MSLFGFLKQNDIDNPNDKQQTAKIHNWIITIIIFHCDDPDGLPKENIPVYVDCDPYPASSDESSHCPFSQSFKQSLPLHSATHSLSNVLPSQQYGSYSSVHSHPIAEHEPSIQRSSKSSSDKSKPHFAKHGLLNESISLQQYGSYSRVHVQSPHFPV